MPRGDKKLTIVLINLLVTSGESNFLTRWSMRQLCEWNVRFFSSYRILRVAYRHRRWSILSDPKSADKRNNSGAIDRPASVPLTEKYAHLSCGSRYSRRRGDIGNYYRLALLSCDIPGVAFIFSDTIGLCSLIYIFTNYNFQYIYDTKLRYYTKIAN